MLSRLKFNIDISWRKMEILDALLQKSQSNPIANAHSFFFFNKKNETKSQLSNSYITYTLSFCCKHIGTAK